MSLLKLADRVVFCSAIALFALALGLFCVPSYASGKQQPDEIVEAYKAAHAKKDIQAVISLVLFQSGSPAQRASWESDFTKEFAQPLSTVTLMPLSSFPMLPVLEDVKKRIRSSVQLVSYMAVEFSNRETGVSTSQIYLIGIENDRYFIIGP